MWPKLNITTEEMLTLALSGYSGEEIDWGKVVSLYTTMCKTAIGRWELECIVDTLRSLFREEKNKKTQEGKWTLTK